VNHFQPIFLENLRISIPGYSILRFAHQRHTQSSDLIEEHRHPHCQFLLYLRGHGVQTTEANRMPVSRGSFLFFPPWVVHGFIKSMASPPISLVINFRQKEKKARYMEHRRLPPVILSRVESILHILPQSVNLTPAGEISTAAKILDIFSILSAELGSKTSSTREVYPLTDKIRRVLRAYGKSPSSPAEIASLLDEDLSSLNRKIRRESNLNLTTLLDERRQELAFTRLREKNARIAEVAWHCGFHDPNYFTRWFRKKVGQSPRQWKISQIDSHAV
jgi:AraC-like DNA-binding protein